MKEKVIKQNVGIDVSKDKIDVSHFNLTADFQWALQPSGNCSIKFNKFIIPFLCGKDKKFRYDYGYS